MISNIAFLKPEIALSTSGGTYPLSLSGVISNSILELGKTVVYWKKKTFHSSIPTGFNLANDIVKKYGGYSVLFFNQFEFWV